MVILPPTLFRAYIVLKEGYTLAEKKVNKNLVFFDVKSLEMI